MAVMQTERCLNFSMIQVSVKRVFHYRTGQIDKILSGKPEERRELFDEAAGIVKFKKRKLCSQKAGR